MLKYYTLLGSGEISQIESDRNDQLGSGDNRQWQSDGNSQFRFDAVAHLPIDLLIAPLFRSGMVVNAFRACRALTTIPEWNTLRKEVNRESG